MPRYDEVTALLGTCGISRFLPVFKDADVDDSCLDPGVLKDADLRELGLPSVQDVRLLNMPEQFEH